MENILDHECTVLTRYLIRQKASDQACQLYRKAHQYIRFDFTEKESRLWRRCINNRLFLYFTDAALAKNKSSSVLRKKLLLAFSILESLPEYHHHFLSPKPSSWNIIKIPFYALRAMLAFLTGKIILAIIK